MDNSEHNPENLLDPIALECAIGQIITKIDPSEYNTGWHFDIKYQNQSFKKLIGKLYFEKTTPMISRNIAMAMIEYRVIEHFYFSILSADALAVIAFLFIASKLRDEINAEYRMQFEKFRNEYLKK